jgi:hypothetical protein
MNKSTFCSRIYVYVSYNPTEADSPCLVNMTNSIGTSIGGGYLDSHTEVADCLTTMGCTQDRLPVSSREADVMRVMTNVRPRDLDAALALLD